MNKVHPQEPIAQNERRSALALIILLSLLALPTTFVAGIMLGAWVDSELEDAWKRWRNTHKQPASQLLQDEKPPEEASHA